MSADEVATRLVLRSLARRVNEGKSRRDATRLLKRYLARHLYRLLENQKPRMARQDIGASFVNTGPLSFVVV